MDFLKYIKVTQAFYLLLALSVVSGCASRTRHAVPSDMLQKAAIPEMEDVRVFPDMPTGVMTNDLIESIKQELSSDFEGNIKGTKSYPVLAISGGSANGAYGAGLLKGWTAHGSRPQFKIVTGISTGALIAPLAFLGSDYDVLLEEFYTTLATKDLIEMKSILGALTGNSVASNKPLANNINKYITKDILAKVAKEHERGRRLYIGTTNLDAQRFVLWNMGKIAERGDEAALNLFRQVMLASAAIPFAFPPEYISVEVDGKIYEEMHVDGGTTTQVFFLYGLIQNVAQATIKEATNQSNFKVNLYIIRNGSVTHEWKVVEDNIASITERSLDTMIKVQAEGDMLRLYFYSQQRGHGYNLAYIPTDFKSEAKEMFDLDEMKKLFDMAFQKAKVGYPWKKKPVTMLKNKEK
jgi:hypothetical protein